jgi:membrane dipeptidase
VIVDGHLDLAYNALVDGRDYHRSALAIRADEAGGPIEASNGRCMVGLPELVAGDVRLIVATLFALPRAEALAQLGIYRRWAAEWPEIDLVTSGDGLERPAGRVGVALLIENADCIRDADDVALFHDAGVRICGPAWLVPNEHVVNGLTREGRAAIDAMDVCGMGLDLSHLNDTAIAEAVRRFDGPVVASHAIPRRVTGLASGLPEFAIREIAARDGVVGIIPMGWALPANTLDAVCDAIEVTAELAGGARHVAIGSDFDGGFGAEQTPPEIDTIADLGVIGAALAARGWSADDVDGVLAGNWLRVLRGLYA